MKYHENNSLNNRNKKENSNIKYFDIIQRKNEHKLIKNDIYNKIYKRDEYARKFINKVIGFCLNKNLLCDLNSEKIPEAKRKSEEYLKTINFGAYTCSKGIQSVRKNISRFISKRDGWFADEENIFITYRESDTYYHLISLFQSGDEELLLLFFNQF